MKTLFFATSNHDKFLEAKKILAKHKIELKKSDIEIVEKKLDTVNAISIDKALTAAKRLQKPLIVEDTGIYFEAFKNFPGPNPAFVFQTIGYEGILKLLEKKKREAHFETVISYWEPNKPVMAFAGTCKGKIAEKVSPIISFAYDAIFIPEGEERTFSEMSKEEKEKYSHRAKALQKFAQWHTKKR